MELEARLQAGAGGSGMKACIPDLQGTWHDPLKEQPSCNIGGLPGGAVPGWGVGESGEKGRAVMGSEEHRGSGWGSATLIASGHWQ